MNLNINNQFNNSSFRLADWDENSNNNFLNNVPSKRSISKILLLILLGLLIVLIIEGVFLFLFSHSTRKTKVANINLSYKKNVESLPEEKNLTSLSNFERSKTNSYLTEETFISFTGSTELEGDVYKGFLEEGFAFPYNKEKYEEQRKIQEEIENNVEAQQSLFLVEARDISDNILSSFPISVIVGIDVDIPIYSYKEPGAFSGYMLLPIKTNSLVLRIRNGKILDRVYVEDWVANIVFKDVSFDSNSGILTIKGNLYPNDKKYVYTLDLLDDESNEGNFERIVVITEPISGEFAHQVDLNKYPQIKGGKVKLRAMAYTPFHIFGPFYYSFSIEEESLGNVKVEISPKDRKIFKTGERIDLEWPILFYDLDVSRGIEELCEKYRVCYELTWSGIGVKFTDKDPAFFPTYCGEQSCTVSFTGDEEYLKDSLTTKRRYLTCVFGGTGNQEISLSVKKNDVFLGKDSYSFSVSGDKESRNKKTVCFIGRY